MDSLIRKLIVFTLVFATGAVSSGQQPGPQAAAPNGPPPAPFQPNPAQQAFVDQVLTAWEQESGKIKTFKCSFEHFQYVLAIAGREIPLHRNRGELVYERPDRGSFHVQEVGTWNNQPGDSAAWPVDKNAVGEHYVCDGKKVYVFNYRAKQLEISPIPVELQGKQIVDGPLPFLFGAQAAKIQARYWIAPTQSDNDSIWLDARPKFAADAANYNKVEVILDRTKLLPKAIKVYRPNGDEDVYVFDLENAKINDKLAQLLGAFTAPIKPWGWTVVEHTEPPEQPPANQPQDARRQSGPPGRF